MECIFLEMGKKSNLCQASYSLMVPTAWEIEFFCTSGEHLKCPVLAARVLWEKESD